MICYVLLGFVLPVIYQIMQLDSRIKTLTTHQNTLFKRKNNFLANVKTKQTKMRTNRSMHSILFLCI